MHANEKMSLVFRSGSLFSGGRSEDNGGGGGARFGDFPALSSRRFKVGEIEKSCVFSRGGAEYSEFLVVIGVIVSIEFDLALIVKFP